MSGFQTSVFRDGSWVTANVSTQEALDATAKLDASKALPLQSLPPPCGILTRTVVPSPVSHWVLPIRIRSKCRIDVAFVGSHAVQISELRRDGQLIDVARKCDFGSRICNAVVMGDTPNTPKDIIGGEQASIKIEDVVRPPTNGPHSTSGSQRRLLPPQILVLFLENGLLIFLFLQRGSSLSWKFEMMHYQTPWTIKNLGFRLAIDPTSRYLAAASSQKAFMVWELESRANIEAQYEKHGTFKPLRQGESGVAVRSFQGTLFHLDFLFPRAEDGDHIILMMVVARRDCHDGDVGSRVLIFDWIAGDNLSTAIEGDGNGIRLPDHYSMPLMIIPLRFKNAMCVVCEHSIGLIRNAVAGSMVCDDLMTERPPRTPLHYGESEPLWSAWARPIRGDWYCKNTDIIMLAREDGYLVHIEVDAANVVPSVTSAGCLDSTVSTGFAMPYIEDADAIIVSGDSSPGGTWKLSPRDDPVRASTLRNWSPVVDITAAPWIAPATPTRATSLTQAPPADAEVLVSASGRGAKGNLASFRWGRQARIGCEIDTGTTVRQIGAFIPPSGPNLLHVALSLPEATWILQFSGDLTEVKALDEDETQLDLRNRTISLFSTPEQLVQVTETSIVVITGSTIHKQLLTVQNILRAEHAVATMRHVVLSTLSTTGSNIYIFSIGSDGILFTASWDIAGEVTSLELTPLRASTSRCLVIATLVDGYPWLSLFELDGRLISSQAITSEEPTSTQHAESVDGALYEGFTSLYILDMSVDAVTLIAGTLWGRIFTINVSLHTGAMTTVHTRKLGRSAVRLFPVTTDGSSGDLAVTCDDSLICFFDYDHELQKHKADTMIVPMSDGEHDNPVPPVQWVAPAPRELRMGSSLTPLLLLAGTRVLIAELSGTTNLVPRCLPLHSTPTKVIYSDFWKCYVVAVSQTGKPTIRFVDPATGLTLSQPMNNAREPMEFASGLGIEGDRILCMAEWGFVKDDRIFPFILVGLQSGLLLTLSAKNTEIKNGAEITRRVDYWTRHKRRGDQGESVYSVLGVSDGIVHCTGTKVWYEALETQEKKLQRVSHFSLESPALALEVREGKLFVLTSRHSLLILDYRNPRQNHPHGQMPLLHTDKATRSTIHMLPVNVPSLEHQTSSITLLSDASSNVVGVWTAIGKKDQSLETVFRAVLPAPIRRFVKGHCRPPWSKSRELGKFGTVRATDDGADIFGVSLDGALFNFTILTVELWELLRFVQSHAEKTAGLAPAASARDHKEPGEDERRRHIDGDMMGHCWRGRMLESIMVPGEVRSNMCKLLDGIEAGSLTSGFMEESEPEAHYFKLLYRILEYLNEPLL